MGFDFKPISDNEIVKQLSDVTDGVNSNTSQLSQIANKRVKIGTVGDSRLADDKTISAVKKGWSNKGIVSWAMFLSDQGYITDESWHKAIGGATTTQILTQALALCAMSNKPNICIVNGDTNDSPYTYDLLVSNYTQITNALTGANIKPIYLSPMPVTTTDSEKKIARARFNSWLIDFCAMNGYIYIDCYNTLMNYTTGEIISTLTRDGTHLNCTGAYQIGKLVATLLDNEYKNNRIKYVLDKFDAYDEIKNPNGTLLPIGRMEGTSGTNTNGASGTGATGWNHKIVSGTCTSVASKEIDASGKNKQVISVSATTDSSVRFRPDTYAIPNISVGDAIYACCDVEIEGESVGLQYVRMNLQSDDGASTIGEVNFFEGDITTAFPLPTDKLTGTYKTGALVIPENTVNTGVSFFINVGAGGSCVVKISNVAVRKL